jgi:hypothetical protein
MEKEYAFTEIETPGEVKMQNLKKQFAEIGSEIAIGG